MWTDELKKEIPEAENDEDGYVFLPVEQFKVSFSRISINFNATKMHMDYHMAWDDQTDNAINERSGTLVAMKKACGAGCKYHKIHVLSKVAQKVWVSHNTYSHKT